jgi:hypothetical protein
MSAADPADPHRPTPAAAADIPVREPSGGVEPVLLNVQASGTFSEVDGAPCRPQPCMAT